MDALGRRCCLTSSSSAGKGSSRSGIRGEADLGPAPAAAGADETADEGGVFGNDGNLPAAGLDAVVHHVAGDLAVTLRGDTGQAGEAEACLSEFVVLTDDAAGMAVADARLPTGAVPGKTEFLS